MVSLEFSNNRLEERTFDDRKLKHETHHTPVCCHLARLENNIVICRYGSPKDLRTNAEGFIINDIETWRLSERSEQASPSERDLTRGEKQHDND